eukprot:GFUD01094711.1.p1 GENE.GFUD01094711.1~~GFUD01094711.1.p1  ORF type:complete len:122 (+),score=18.64 GFUD01094711.1:86-451(+)
MALSTSLSLVMFSTSPTRDCSCNLTTSTSLVLTSSTASTVTCRLLSLNIISTMMHPITIIITRATASTEIVTVALLLSAVLVWVALLSHSTLGHTTRPPPHNIYGGGGGDSSWGITGRRHG